MIKEISLACAISKIMSQEIERIVRIWTNEGFGTCDGTFHRFQPPSLAHPDKVCDCSHRSLSPS